MGIVTDDLVQQSAPERLLGGAKPVDPVMLRDGPRHGSSTVRKSMLQRSLSDTYGTFCAGYG